MTKVISFTSAIFDPSKEPPNPINPIAGQALLLWLSNQLKQSGITISPPDTEDWGWYIDATRNERGYMIGASGEADEGNPDISWTIQIEKYRNFWQKITGQNKMTEIDEMSVLIENFIRSESSFSDIEVSFES